jgi:hypothetical protein
MIIIAYVKAIVELFALLNIWQTFQRSARLLIKTSATGGSFIFSCRHTTIDIRGHYFIWPVLFVTFCQLAYSVNRRGYVVRCLAGWNSGRKSETILVRLNDVNVVASIYRMQIWKMRALKPVTIETISIYEKNKILPTFHKIFITACS